MAAQERKSPYGINRLVTFPVTADSEEAFTCGDAYPISKSIMSFDFQAASQSAKQYAENQEVEYIVVNTGGTLNVTLTQLSVQDHIELLGAKATPDGKGYIINKDDFASYNCVAIASTVGGKLNLYKFFKVKFAKGQTSIASTGEGAPQFATNPLNGSYVPTLYGGNAMAEAKGLDPSVAADAAFIEKWFTEGDFIGETTGE